MTHDAWLAEAMWLHDKGVAHAADPAAAGGIRAALRAHLRVRPGGPEQKAEAERDVALKQWEKEQRRREVLEREVRYLRHYGNKDCTAMADKAMQEGELDKTISQKMRDAGYTRRP